MKTKSIDSFFPAAGTGLALLIVACSTDAPPAFASSPLDRTVPNDAPVPELAPAAPLETEPEPAALALLGDGSDEAEAPTDGAALLEECLARMPVERVFLAGTLNMRRRYGVTITNCAFEVAADYRTPALETDYRLANPATGATLLAARTRRDPVRGLVVERTDGAPPPASAGEPILGTDVTWFDVGVDFVNWRNPALAGEDRLKGRVCDLLDVEPPSPVPGCAKARLWIDRAQKVVLQAAQMDEAGRAVRKLWIRAVQKVDEHWIFKDLEVETAGTGHRTRLHFEHVSFPDSALRPAAP